MPSQLRTVRWAICLLPAFLFTGCAATTVNSYVERGTDFSRYRTYKFGPAGQTSTGDPRLDHNPFFDRRVQEDIDKGLAAKGLERTGAARADLLVHYHASVSQQIAENTLDRYDCTNVNCRPDCATAECRPYVYDAGTLLIDLVDARTHKVVWRGWAQGSFDGALDNQEAMEARVDDSVKRILEKLPPRL